MEGTSTSPDGEADPAISPVGKRPEDRLCGRYGTGKTITNLINRFYDIAGGKILRRHQHQQDSKPDRRSLALSYRTSNDSRSRGTSTARLLWTKGNALPPRSWPMRIPSSSRLRGYDTMLTGSSQSHLG